MPPKFRRAAAAAQSPLPADAGDGEPGGGLAPAGRRVLQITPSGHVRAQEPGWFPVSHTSIWKYKTCPRQFKLAIETGVDVSGDPAEMGTELHELQESIEAGEQHEETNIPLGSEKAYFELKRKLLAKGRTANAQTEVELFTEWEIPELELRVQLRAFVDSLALDHVRGIADLEDLKTGRVVKYGEHQAQRKTYGLCVIRNHGDIWLVRARTRYIRWQAEEGEPKTEEYGFGALEEYAVALETQVRQMAEDTVFEPKPGPHCKNCAFAHRCDAGERYLAPFKLGDRIEIPKKVTTVEEVEQLARARFYLDKLRDDVTAALKEAFDRLGPIRLDDLGGQFDNKYVESETIRDIDGLLEVAKHRGLPLSELVRFNAQQGKKYINDFPELKAMAEPSKSRYPRFEWVSDPKPKKAPKKAEDAA